MQIPCKFLTSQKEANDALGPKGSLGCRKQPGKERGRGEEGGDGRVQEALATSENVLLGPVSDLEIWGEGQDELLAT